MLIANVSFADPTITMLSSKGTVCDGESFTLTINSSQKIWFFVEVDPGSGWSPASLNLFTTGSGSSWTYSITNISISASSSFRIKYSTISNADLTANPIIKNTGLFINWNPIPNATVAANNTICNGVSINIGSSTVSGSTYSWSSSAGSYSSTSPNPSVTPNITQTYTLTETITSTGCNNSNSVLINVNARPIVNITSSNTTICDGNNVSIHMNVTAFGTWTITVSDGIVNGTGSGDKIFIRGPNITSEYHIVNAVDANCTSISSDLTGSITITVNPIPTVAAITSQVKCNGVNSAAINFSGLVSGTTYAWTNTQSSIGIGSSGSGDISSVVLANTTNSPVNGIFSVVPTANGCSGTAGAFSITVNPTPTVNSITSQVKCNGVNSAAINFSGSVTGATYAWTNTQSSIGIGSSGSGDISSVALANTTSSPIIGTFSVLPSANGCSGTAGAFSITVNPTPLAPNVSDKEYCFNETAVPLTATNLASHNLAWYVTDVTGGTSASTAPTPLTTTVGVLKYYVSQTNTANSCESPRAAININVKALPPTPTITSNSPVCEGAALTLNTANISGAIYYWEGVNGFTSSSVNPTINNATSAIAGNYSLKIKFNGCVSPLSTPLVVAVNPIPAAPTISSNSPIEEDKTLNLTASNVPGATYAWSGPNGFTSNIQNPAVIASFANAGSYYATLTLNGCTSANSSAIVVVVTPKSSPVFQIPNAFTPNSDGHNDTFKIIQNGYVTRIIGFKIFTKSGKLIFSNTEEAWDGRFAGVMLDSDVYIWIADFMNKNNIQEHLTGTVLLLK